MQTTKALERHGFDRGSFSDVSKNKTGKKNLSGRHEVASGASSARFSQGTQLITLVVLTIFCLMGLGLMLGAVSASFPHVERQCRSKCLKDFYDPNRSFRPLRLCEPDLRLRYCDPFFRQHCAHIPKSVDVVENITRCRAVCRIPHRSDSDKGPFEVKKDFYCTHPLSEPFRDGNDFCFGLKLMTRRTFYEPRKVGLKVGEWTPDLSVLHSNNRSMI